MHRTHRGANSNAPIHCILGRVYPEPLYWTNPTWGCSAQAFQSAAPVLVGGGRPSPSSTPTSPQVKLTVTSFSPGELHSPTDLLAASILFSNQGQGACAVLSKWRILASFPRYYCARIGRYVDPGWWLWVFGTSRPLLPVFPRFSPTRAPSIISGRAMDTGKSLKLLASRNASGDEEKGQRVSGSDWLHQPGMDVGNWVVVCRCIPIHGNGACGLDTIYVACPGPGLHDLHTAELPGPTGEGHLRLVLSSRQDTM